ncbi:restriction endonuclease subunit S [Bizionia saleffrena]|uniref:restriction endonuclease subunit S n=1 Tax=Bizionia saleffrena TaxID=291189 RepID=UPI001478ACBA|nr:restriction endonuclease subunit S [Bizionia saleffrena]
MLLLQHFKELTIRPKNAKELKGLILKLAIQGKLTSNWRIENPNLKPTSELLEELKTEKKKLIKEKKIKNEKPLSSVKKEELIVNLPNSWETVRLGEIGVWGAGSTPLRSNSSFYGGEINWFKSGELNNSIMDYESKEKITELALEKTSVRLNNPGDVLIAMYGATIGKTGILQVVGTTNQAVCACTPFSCINSLFLHLLLKGLKDTFINQGEGGAQPNISRVKIRTQVFGLPPLKEQKEIVNVVETLFKEVEQLEQLTVARIGLKEDFVTSALNQLTSNNANQEWRFLQEHFKSFFNETTNIKKFRETVLQLAVQGKLTADWRANNPDTQSVSQSIEEAFNNQKIITTGRKKFLKPVANVIFNDKEIPLNWVKTQFFNLCVLKRGHDLPKQDRILGKYAVASSGGISGWHNEYKSERGVVIGRSGSTGKPHLIENKHWPLNTVLYGEDYCGNYIDYVFVFLKAFDFSQYSSSTAVPTLNRNKFLNELIIIPPLEEQKAIVEKVNALMGLCDGLEQEVQQSQEYSEMMMQSVLRAVFEGGIKTVKA